MSALALLLRRDFALLWWSGLISRTGDWMLRVALPIHVYQLTGSPLATSATLLAAIGPQLLFGSVAGTFVDRWDRRRTMIVGNILLAVALLPLWLVVSADGAWIVYLVAAFGSVAALFVGPAEDALLPTLVGDDDLLAANVLNSLNNNIARLLGPPLGGIVATAGGLAAVAASDMATFGVAALLVTAMRVRSLATAATPVVRGIWRRMWREWMLGLAYVKDDRALCILFGVVALSGLGEGVMGVLFVLFVSDVLGGDATHLGALMSAQAAGSLLGLAVLLPWSRRVRPDRLFGSALVCFGAIDLLIFNAPAVLPIFALQVALFVAVGVPVVVLGPSMMTVLQNRVADGYRGRVFGSLGTTAALFGVVGLVMAGLLVDRLGVVTILNVQGAAHIAAGAVVLRWLAAAGRTQSVSRHPVPQTG